MMPSSNILMIVGLPASGKTTLAKKINKDNNSKYRIIDDPKDFMSDIYPYLNENLIITDPKLCIENNRNSATNMIRKYTNSKIDWLFFENNPAQCILNAKNRPDKKVESLINLLSKDYKIPEGSNTCKVYIG